MTETKEHEYTTHKYDLIVNISAAMIMFILLYFLALRDSSVEYMDLLPVVETGVVTTPLSVVVLIISMAVATVLAVLFHESIHYVGYSLSGTKPKLKRRGFNLYVTNLEQSISLRNKLWIDALPTIVGLLFVFVFVFINQSISFSVILNYSIATVLIWSVALSGMDWRNIYQLYKKVGKPKEYKITHREKPQYRYPIGIIEKK